MKFLQSLIEPKTQPVEQTIVEAENTHEVDSNAMRVGDFLIWASAFRVDNDVLTEVIVRVHNEANKTTYYVEFFPKEGTKVYDITPQDIQAGEVSVSMAQGKYAGKPVDEETSAFVTKLVHNYLSKELNDVIANELNPEIDPDFEDSWEARRERQRQAADARAELDID